ncbi:GlcG/HbpS family heme-binding protein [Jannaschia sp. LMIT008]|uniref:GlcG/HbpS family heme-binding protein n=1 Tax=Jannaschia maritima TaxID=3032585 RepID=UPI002810AE05|nr:heme-binding protein [Jannaschia sp. LMIT008]
MDLTHAPPTVTYDAAAALVAAALRHARARGWSVAVAVVDPNGDVIAAARPDGVRPTTLRMATDKAVTTTLGKTTLAFMERMRDPALAGGLSSRTDLLAWEGGQPIRLDGTLVGGMGASGASGHQDAECVATALAELGFDPA